MRRKAYGALRVNHVDAEALLRQRPGHDVVVGTDIGKFEMQVICRWPDGAHDRPWRVQNPGQLPELIGLLQRLGQGRRLVVGMEPSGTYGDALRQACTTRRWKCGA